MNTLDFPTAIEAAGVSVEVLDGWNTVNGHQWRTGDPEGHQWHHSATTGYTPNRNVANGWLGMGIPGGNRLYQAGGAGRIPIYVIGNAYPAPIGSGYGRQDVLTDYVRKDIPYVGKQTLPDDSPQWAGNRSYWNTEIVLDGVGGEMMYGVWEAAVTIGAVINDVMGWTVARNIGHGQHTRRKIDLYDGRFTDMAATIDALRYAMEDTTMGCPWINQTDSAKPWFTTYPACNMHYDFGEDIVWETNTGVCSVPPWGTAAYDWARGTGRVNVADTSRDDFNRQLTDGRYMIFEHRAR